MTVRIICADVMAGLSQLPDESVHCVVTSPPYWGLRDYGTPRQLGLEPTLGEHIEAMVRVFREVRRVLRKDGTLWLNYGDCYAASPNGRSAAKTKDLGNDDRTFRDKPFSTVGPIAKLAKWSRESERNGHNLGGADGSVSDYRPMWLHGGLKPKDLCGVPWRIAFALQADGWWLRQDIIWSKPNPMPESIKDRCTKAHEYLFMLTKAQRYYYDNNAIREPYSEASLGRYEYEFQGSTSPGRHKPGNADERYKNRSDHQPNKQGRNKRSVWEIATQPFPEAHFATFPQALIEPCIKAGTSERGCCAECGAPWVRQVQASGGTIGKSWHDHKEDLRQGQRSDEPSLARADGGSYRRETLGWLPSCKCGALSVMGGISHEISSCTVLDPFGGSGTTGLVADRLKRNAILIELNPAYAAMAEKRIKGDCPMFSEVST